MNMAKKIEGHTTEADTNAANGIWLFRDRETANKATLVIHDDKRERVYTESEVKAILVNITHECGCYEHRGEPVFATNVDDINHIAAKHGIVLDPA